MPGMLNGFDIALLTGSGILVFVGLAKGMVRILVGLAALVAAFGMAALFHRQVADQLGWMDLPAEVVTLIAYVVIVLGVMSVGGIVAMLVRKLLRAAMLGWADRLGGALLGLVTAMLVAALVVLPLVAYAPSGSSLLDRSVLAPYVAAVADLAAPLVPDDLARLYEERMELLRRLWQERPMEIEARPLDPV